MHTKRKHFINSMIFEQETKEQINQIQVSDFLFELLKKKTKTTNAITVEFPDLFAIRKQIWEGPDKT